MPLSQSVLPSLCTGFFYGDEGTFFSPPQDIILSYTKLVCVDTVHEYFRTALKSYLPEV